MKILRSIILSLLIIMTSFCGVFADEGVVTVNASADDGKISITGTVPNKNSTLVAVKILNPNGDLIYMNDKKSNEDGTFSFTAPLKEKIKGDYTVWASCMGYENAKCVAYLDVSDKKEILAFSVNGVPGKISGTSITIETTGRIGESAAEFALSERAYAEVDGVIQESGVTTNDFRYNVKYTVIAEDGSSAVYTVHVVQKETSAKGSGGGGGGSSSSSKKNNSSDVRVLPQTPADKSDTDDKQVFPDVPKTHWAYEYIKKLASDGIISGDDSGNFFPDKNVSREEFVKMIVSASGISPVYTDSEFEDIDIDSWYAPYILSAVKAGYVNGESSVAFGIGKSITREDMALIIARCKNDTYKSPIRKYTPFSDESDISEYAINSVRSLYESGLIDGIGDGSFSPKAFATRAQAAKLICSIFDK